VTSHALRYTGRAAAFSIILGFALASSGCSIALNHSALDSPPHSYSDPVEVSKQSEGRNGRVGWGRITVFYIPCVPIHVQGDANEEVMAQVSDALQQLGYKTSVVEAQASAGAPVLKAKVDNFYFNNYTWLFPFVPT
jgi:hypothetical protein